MPILHYNPPGKTVANIFALFSSQPSHIPALSGYQVV